VSQELKFTKTRSHTQALAGYATFLFANNTFYSERANWPIQEHWNRVITFAAAWSGANPSIDAKWKGSEDLMSAISKGLDYWFDNDYEPADCMGNGG